MSFRAFPANKTCSDFLRDGARPVPDADISGLGVILAFTLSAYLTFLLVLASYLFGQVDASLLNTVDTHVFRIRPRKIRSHGDGIARFRTSLALRQVILALSDQQIVTGIAIMAAGFQGLRLGGIDSYHYQNVIYLAWMSSSVHLSALSILAPLLKERPALRIWRLTGMITLLVLLIIGLIPTIGNDWGELTWVSMIPENSGWGVPAVCFWGKTWRGGVNADAVLSFMILVISYGWKVGGLFDSACSAHRRWTRYPVEWMFEHMLAYTARKLSSACRRNSRMRRLGWLIAYRLVVSFWVPYFAIVETLASFSMAVWVSCIGLVFGTIQIAVPRRQNLPLLGSNEDIWGFGQLVPLILLIQPFSVIWEHLIVAKSAKQDEHEHGTDAGHDNDANHQKDVYQEKYASTCSSLTATASSPSLQESDVQEQRPAQTLLLHLAHHAPARPSERTLHQPTSIEHVLLESRTFHVSVFLTQPTILTASILALKTDARLIGITTTVNWGYFSATFVLYVCLAWLATLCLTPWSNIGRMPTEWQTLCDTISERVEGGMGSGQRFDVSGT